jgi:hypothetical protein
VNEDQWRVHRRLLGHTISLPDGETRDSFLEQFSEVVRRFTGAMARALPGLSETEILWRLFFMIGTVIQTLAMVEDLPRFAGDRGADTGPDTVERWMLPFITAGLQAPPADANVEADDA